MSCIIQTVCKCGEELTHHEHVVTAFEATRRTAQERDELRALAMKQAEKLEHMDHRYIGSRPACPAGNDDGPCDCGLRDLHAEARRLGVMK